MSFNIVLAYSAFTFQVTRDAFRCRLEKRDLNIISIQFPIFLTSFIGCHLFPALRSHCYILSSCLYLDLLLSFFCCDPLPLYVCVTFVLFFFKIFNSLLLCSISIILVNMPAMCVLCFIGQASLLLYF